MTTMLGKSAVLLLLVALCSSQTVYEVGVSVVDVTATYEQLRGGECWLGGYGFWYTRGRPEGVHDPTYSRAWVVSDGNSTLAFATLDFAGLSNRMIRFVRNEVERLIGIPYGNVHISATHTHSGPDGQGLWGGISANYNQTVLDGTIKSIVDAYNSRQPAFIYASKGNNTVNNSNRRGHGYTDAETTVLDFIAVGSGARIGAVVNYAAHPVTLSSSNLLVSGDWCEYTRLRMEASLNAPVIFVNGAIGDVSPSGGSGSGFERSESTGNGVADAALAFMAAEQVPLEGPVFGMTYQYRHAVTNVAFIAAHLIGWLDYDFFDLEDGYFVDTQVSYWRIGNNLDGLSFPGECLTRLAYPIKDAMTAEFRLFAGLTGDTLGYFVPSDEWNYIDGYEEKVSIDKWVGDVTRDLLIEIIQSNKI